MLDIGDGVIDLVVYEGGEVVDVSSGIGNRDERRKEEIESACEK